MSKLELQWKMNLGTINRIMPFLELVDVYNYIEEKGDTLCNIVDGNGKAPKELYDAMRTALKEDEESPPQGRRTSESKKDQAPRLEQALARCYSGPFGRQLDPKKEIFVTQSGDNGVEAIIEAFIGYFANVVIIQPCAPYELLVSRSMPFSFGFCGATAINLTPPEQYEESRPASSQDWTLDMDELRTKTKGAKFLILNNPNEPTGKVFSMSELKTIAEICVENDVFAIEMVAFEHFVYEDDAGDSFKDSDSTWNSLPRLAAMPEMACRTLTVGSATRTFNASGWNMGWVIADEEIIQDLNISIYMLPRDVPKLDQEAVGVALEGVLEKSPKETFLSRNRKDLRKKRDALVKAFYEAGLRPFKPRGGVQFIVDVSASDSEGTEGESRFDRLFRWLTMDKGLVVDPIFPYYFQSIPEFVTDMIGVTFDKDWDTIQRAVTIIAEWGSELRNKKDSKKSSSCVIKAEYWE